MVKSFKKLCVTDFLVSSQVESLRYHIILLLVLLF